MPKPYKTFAIRTNNPDGFIVFNRLSEENQDIEVKINDIVVNNLKIDDFKGLDHFLTNVTHRELTIMP